MTRSRLVEKIGPLWVKSGHHASVQFEGSLRPRAEACRVEALKARSQAVILEIT